MRSAGEQQIEAHVRVVRVHMQALQQSLVEALAFVPEDMRSTVRIRIEEEQQQEIRRATVLSEGGPHLWFNSWDTAVEGYWTAQREYLIDRQGWQVPQVDSLDQSSDEILSHLEDPRTAGPENFDVRGLVVGYVQSGKTASFCALAAKAADAGYKLVIVLSGIHNSLRLQTQRRLNRALGVDYVKGVRRPEPGRQWIAFTRDHLAGDFHPGSIQPEVLQGNDHVLMVVKKNKTILNRVIDFVGRGAPPTLPVLIIDDEADQASINTGGNRTGEPVADITDLTADDVDGQISEDEVDPSVINGLIRQLLSSLHRVSYVAYTATPFANVLIHHNAEDREVGRTLYPSDFIVSLPEPAGYVGSERIFGRDLLPGEDGEGRSGLSIIRHVPDWEADELTPPNREIDTYTPRITDSLGAAFYGFILATVARQHREGTDGPATMLIHTHHRKPVQNRLAAVVRDHVAELRQLWRYDRSSIRETLRACWDSDFRPTTAALDASKDVPFEELEPFIDGLFRERLSVVLLNSDSEDELDYETDPNIKAVVIGGNRLSRGLTLEGLLISFYVRYTDAYDTLMQMGRWFGFREPYVELTRIWTTELLGGMFRDLALAEADLREEIERYRREGLTPRQFGPKVRSHPFMLVTARNKMGSGRTVSQNYSQKLLQTINFRLSDPNWLRSNLHATRDFIQELGEPVPTSEGMPFPTWTNVPWERIIQFFGTYTSDPRSGIVDMSAIRKYVQNQVDNGELTRWCVVMRGLANPDTELGTEPELAVGGIEIGCISRTRLRNVPYSVGTLINGSARSKSFWSGDDELCLSREQLEAARQESGRYGEALRAQRSPQEGLLLLYPISRFSRPRPSDTDRSPLFENPAKGCTVVGLAVSLPKSESDGTVEYVVGSAGAVEEVF